MDTVQKQMKIAVSGAGGFLGREATDLLALDPLLTIHALFSPHKTLPPAGPRFVPFQGDLREPKETRAWLKGCDVVLHLAERGRPTEPLAEAEGRVVANLTSAARLIDSMKSEGVKKLIYASSGGALYRGIPAGTLDESSPLAIRTPYAMTKFLLEKRFMDLASDENWQVTILRVANPYGIHQIGRTNQGIIGAAIEKLFQNEELPLWVPLTTAKDFLSAHDVCRAFQLALRSTTSGIFNIGSGHGTTLQELFTTLEKVSARKLLVKNVPLPLTEAERVALNCTKAKQTLGWSMTIRLEEGIETLWRHRIGGKAKPIKRAA